VEGVVRKQIPEIGRIFFGTDRYTEVETINNAKIKIPKFTIADACNADLTDCITNVMLISGEINTATLKSLNELSDKSHDIDTNTLCLNSIGGSVETATLINKYIAENDLNTCLAARYIIKDLGKFQQSNLQEYVVKHDSCYSACPLVIASAEKRTLLGDSFIIGVHSSGFKVFGKIHVDMDGEEYREYISNEMESFFDFTQTVPSENMYIFSEYQLRASKLFNEYRGIREGKSLVRTLKNCKSNYFITSNCPLEGVIDPYPQSDNYIKRELTTDSGHL
uniref:hypothetical protein n=1 Tax=Vibrio vulnificus TaxID=672 RepID=UPI0010EE0B73